MMEESREQNKKHIVLVHGSCHGAWCWYKVATLLEAAGFRVTAPDLAASGIDLRRLSEVPTLAAYSQPLLDVVASLPDREKAVLVGHSFGGLSVALAADRFPDKVAAAVFVTAFMPDCTSRPSYVFEKYLEQNPPVASVWMDTRFNFGEGATVPGSLLFGPRFMASRLYQLCPPEDVMLGTTLVREASQFVEDLGSLPAFSEDGYGSVATAYIVCGQDAAISEDYQRFMIRNHPVKEVIEIEGADHMPMLSTPQELCRSLISIADHASYSTA
ncbi:salicylic acid-binding protein 2-like [Iris pallida]|uniref:Salicylic acid-binding protein 2-like n=1 Tax=Iris pallida TaxID=29817 RepID=A0AAX6ICS4_IRIPA|nr:salicylic acid-binding protein 2-like [Iris pallida]